MSLARAREVSVCARSQIYYMFSQFKSQIHAQMFSQVLPCSEKKENAKVWTNTLDNIRIIFVILSSYNVAIFSFSGKKNK